MPKIDLSPPEEKAMPWGGFDFSKPSRAVIAFGARDAGAVLQYVGGHISMDIEETGLPTPDDLGLTPPADGLWIWEGIHCWSPGPWEHPQDGDLTLEGSFRRLTDDELHKVAKGEQLWNPEEWLLAEVRGGSNE